MRCEWYPRRDGQLYASEATGGFWPGPGVREGPVYDQCHLSRHLGTQKV